jgi:hypothetical protein
MLKIKSFGLIAIVGLLCTGGIFNDAWAAKPPEPTMGADSAAKVLARFADAVDNGNVADAQACLATSTEGAKKFEAFIIKLAQCNGSRKQLLDQIESKFGKDVRAEAAPLVAPSGDMGSYSVLKSASGDDLKDGAKVQIPGFKGAAKLMKSGDHWIIDPTEVLEGVNQEYLDGEFAHDERLLKACHDAADAAGSAKELIQKMKDEARK